MEATDPTLPAERGLRSAWIIAGIYLATLLAYLPAITGGFIWDDDGHVTRLALRSVRGLWRIWFELGATQQYYPVLHSAFWVEHRLWGDSAIGYHLANILLHATSACLIAAILRRLAIPGAWLAALIFALHPVCVESVAWISEQKNTLSTVFYLLAVLAYLRFDRERRSRVYFLASGLFLLALLSKSVTATLPAALLVIIWWKRGRLSWKADVLPLLPWLALSAAAGILTAWVERTYIGARGSDFNLSAIERCLLASRVIWFYLGKLLWPANLIFIYPRWTVDGGAGRQYLFILGVAVLLVALVRLSRRNRGPLAAFLFFSGTLFPALGFFNVYPFIFSYVADHFQYLASLGIITLVAGGWGSLGENPPTAGAAAPMRKPGGFRYGSGTRQRFAFNTAVLGLLGLLTWRQCGMYRNAETLYRTTIAKNPACWMAHNNLGFVWEGQGRGKEALPEYEEALRLRPNYVEAHNNLGAALFDSGRAKEAIAHFEAALQLMPTHAGAHNNLGNALVEVGRAPEGIAQYEEAMRLDPDFPDPPYNLALAYSKLGRLSEAEDAFKQAIRLRPGYAEAYNKLGNTLAREGRFPDAIAAYGQAVRLDPRYADAQENLGQILDRSGNPEEALNHYRAALQARPDDAAIHYLLGNALSELGRRPEAMAEFERVVQLDPRHAEAHNNIGAMLLLMNRPSEAIPEFEEALRLQPDAPAIHGNLGRALNAVGRSREAADQFARAEELNRKASGNQ